MLEPAIREHGRMDPMGEVAQLGEAVAELAEHVGEFGLPGVGNVGVGGEP